MSSSDRKKGAGRRRSHQSESQRIVANTLEVLENQGGSKTRGDAEEFPVQEPGFFHTAAREAWARLRVGDHVECHAIGSKAFTNLMAHELYRRTGTAAKPADLKTAARLLEARALFDSPEEEIFIRAAGDQNRIVIDLGDARWRALAVTARGIEILDRHPLNFRRSASMRPLPEPYEGSGDLMPLRTLFPTLADDEIWALVSAWMVSCFRPSGSYAHLALSSEAGSGKTTLANMLMSLVDPSETQLRSPPRSARDLTAACCNSRVLGLENVSVIRPWLSDGLCRLSTRGADAERRLFSNAAEHYVTVGGPVLLTSVPDVVAAEDLRDRTLTVHVKYLPDGARLTDAQLKRWFDRQGPVLFKGLLEALSTGLRRLPSVVPSQKTRMLDHLVWALACAPALGLSEEIITKAHVANRDAAASEAVGDSLVGAALLRLLERTPRWEGTALDLLNALNVLVHRWERQDQEWPRSARDIGGKLRRLEPVLRRVDIEMTFNKRGHKSIRLITIVQRDRSQREERSDGRSDRPHRPHRPPDSQMMSGQ